MARLSLMPAEHQRGQASSGVACAVKRGETGVLGGETDVLGGASEGLQAAL